MQFFVQWDGINLLLIIQKHYVLEGTERGIFLFLFLVDMLLTADIIILSINKSGSSYNTNFVNILRS